MVTLRDTVARSFLVVALALGGCSGQSPAEEVPVVKISAERWDFMPNVVTLKQGVTVDFELTSRDVHHRFYVPDFGIDADIIPGQTMTVRFTPDRAGTFPFRCEYYCGMGHEGMVGHITVD